MKKIYFFIWVCSVYSFYLSQDSRDVVRYSQTQYYGTARFESMAGSFGALGADLSSVQINPAGLGRYSKSVFSFNLQNTTVKNQSTFNNQQSTDQINLFRLNNLGVLICNDVSENNRGFIFNQIAFSYNRVENLKDQYSYKGQQFASLLDEFAAMASGLSSDDIYAYLPFTSALAWDTYSIDSDNENGYIPRLTANDVIHRRNIENKGGISEYNFNISGNYNHKLYVGGNIGLKSVRYFEDYYHYEHAPYNDALSLDSFQYDYHLKTKGSGFNFKIGAIYLPYESLRIGISIHTPTFLKLKDYYSANMISYHKDTTYSIPEDYQPKGEYKYKLTQSPKMILSVAYIFQTKGAINVDVDIIPYQWSRFASTDDTNYEPYDYTTTNNDVKKLLKTGINARIGGELALFSHLFLRAGFAYYSNAYHNNIAKVKPQLIGSGGMGFRWKKNAFDFAVKYENRTFYYYAFSQSETKIKQNRLSFSLSYSLFF
ncbi:MAG: outer membrane protein transport protein [Flavobacteriia bacterium]|nr:outer membrane protein transport protein [Flavobacteriia bacterium]